MKVLLIDDQELVLLTIEKLLIDLGYLVQSVNNMAEGIQIFDSYEPDLVITDIDMPVIPNSTFEFKTLDFIKKKSGLEVIKYIRLIKKSPTPIMVLSGNKHPDMIASAFSLGANEYMVKPLSLNEIGSRVERLIGSANKHKPVKTAVGMIQKSCVGIVIPFNYKPGDVVVQEWSQLVKQNLNYHICLVNYNLEHDCECNQLEELKGTNKRITVLNFKEAVTKAEAIRLGVLYLEQKHQFDFIVLRNTYCLNSQVGIKDAIEIALQMDCKYSHIGTTIVSDSGFFHKIIQKLFMGIPYNLIKQFGYFQQDKIETSIFSTEIVKDVFQSPFKVDSNFQEEIKQRAQPYIL